MGLIGLMRPMGLMGPILRLALLLVNFTVKPRD